MRAPSSRRIAVAGRFKDRHTSLLAGLVGISIPIARGISEVLAVQIEDLTEVVLLAALYLVSITFLCWPWTNLRLAFRLSWVAASALILAGAISTLIRYGLSTRLVPWIFPVGFVVVFVCFCVVTFAFVTCFVLVRMRFWPIYPLGHCTECGYDLTGNVSGTCPECGNQLNSMSTVKSID
jgi:hypothetical protein